MTYYELLAGKFCDNVESNKCYEESFNDFKIIGKYGRFGGNPLILSRDIISIWVDKNKFKVNENLFDIKSFKNINDENGFTSVVKELYDNDFTLWRLYEIPYLGDFDDISGLNCSHFIVDEEQVDFPNGERAEVYLNHQYMNDVSNSNIISSLYDTLFLIAQKKEDIFNNNFYFDYEAYLNETMYNFIIYKNDKIFDEKTFYSAELAHIYIEEILIKAKLK